MVTGKKTWLQYLRPFFLSFHSNWVNALRGLRFCERVPKALTWARACQDPLSCLLLTHFLPLEGLWWTRSPSSTKREQLVSFTVLSVESLWLEFVWFIPQVWIPLDYPHIGHQHGPHIVYLISTYGTTLCGLVRQKKRNGRT